MIGLTSSYLHKKCPPSLLTGTFCSQKCWPIFCMHVSIRWSASCFICRCMLFQAGNHTEVLCLQITSYSWILHLTDTTNSSYAVMQKQRWQYILQLRDCNCCFDRDVMIWQNLWKYHYGLMKNSNTKCQQKNGKP